MRKYTSRQAQHYLMLARQMTHGATKGTMIDLAGLWMRLAQQAELNERLVQLQQEMLVAQG